jgi:CheY-like chemotaxis protein
LNYSYSKRILICADDRRLIGNLQRVLAPHVVEITSSGSDCLTRVGEFQPDMLLVQTFLRDMDAFDLLARIKHKTSSSPVIVLVASVNPREAAEQMASLRIAATILRNSTIEQLRAQLQPFFEDQLPSLSESKADVKTSKPSVLVVEDSSDSAHTVETLLLTLGYSVTIAETAERAMDLLPRYPYNALLLALRLPGMSGVEMLARIRHGGNRIPCVVVTGSKDQQDHRVLKDLGVRAVFSKPADYARVADAINELISNS